MERVIKNGNLEVFMFAIFYIVEICKSYYSLFMNKLKKFQREDISFNLTKNDFYQISDGIWEIDRGGILKLISNIPKEIDFKWEVLEESCDGNYAQIKAKLKVANREIVTTSIFESSEAKDVKNVTKHFLISAAESRVLKRAVEMVLGDVINRFVRENLISKESSQEEIIKDSKTQRVDKIELESKNSNGESSKESFLKPNEKIDLESTIEIPQDIANVKRALEINPNLSNAIEVDENKIVINVKLSNLQKQMINKMKENFKFKILNLDNSTQLLFNLSNETSYQEVA